MYGGRTVDMTVLLGLLPLALSSAGMAVVVVYVKCVDSGAEETYPITDAATELP